MRFNTDITMKDIFANPQMAEVVPQFSPNETRLSLPEIQDRIGQYIERLYGGRRRLNGDIEIEGEHEEVMRNVTKIAPKLEQMYGSMESVGNAMQRNAPLYTPFNSVAQAAEMKTPEQRAQLLEIVSDNIEYNPEIAPVNNDPEYKRRQMEWLALVGHPMQQAYRRQK